MTGSTSDRPTNRLAYSVDEAAAITGLSRDLLYDQMRAQPPGLPQDRPPAHHHPPAPGSLPHPAST